MEECTCSEKTSYKCNYCRFLCAKSLKEHDILSTEKNIFEEKIATLKLDHIVSIKSNLTGKIQIITECSNTIIYRTQILIAKIQSLCLQSINRLNIKKHYYINLLKNCDKSDITKERKSILKE